MKLVHHWSQYRMKHLATVALREQLDGYEAAFYAGATAALRSLVIADQSAGCMAAIADMAGELQARQDARGGQ